MNEKHIYEVEQPEFDEQDKKIFNAFVDLGWLNSKNEEKDSKAKSKQEQCPSLPPELSDSSLVLKRIRNRKNKNQINSDEAGELNETTAATVNSQITILDNRGDVLLGLTPTLLSLIRQATKDFPSSIAQKLGITVAFMRGCSDHSESVPKNCKKELVDRTCSAFHFLDREKVRLVVENPKLIATAGFRDTPYSGNQMSFEEIVEKSGMNEKAQRFWLELAREKNDEVSK